MNVWTNVQYSISKMFSKFFFNLKFFLFTNFIKLVLYMGIYSCGQKKRRTFWNFFCHDHIFVSFLIHIIIKFVNTYEIFNIKNSHLISNDQNTNITKTIYKVLSGKNINFCWSFQKKSFFGNLKNRSVVLFMGK